VIAARIPVILATATLAAALAAAMPFQRGTPPIGVPAAIDTGRPALTLLYQNFPNPFPTVGSGVTCIWFDLTRTTSVSLTIHDVRGNLVRTVVPNASSPQIFVPGRYGRATPTAETGCDPVYTWDGRANDGSFAPAGVYLIRLRAGGAQSVKKAVFQGP
jgi:hypothetical protein